MSDFRLADGWLPTPNTVEEITHVVIAHVEPNPIAWKWLVQQVSSAGFNPTPCDKNPTFRSQNLDTVLLSFFVHHSSARIAGGRAVAGVRHPISVDVFDAVLAGGGIPTRNRLDYSLSFDG